MPCTDVRENLEIAFDASYHVLDYSVAKKTCGAQVGSQALLLDWVKAKKPDEILAMHMDDFLCDYYDLELNGQYDVSNSQDFLVLKHFEFLKQAFQILYSDSNKDGILVDFFEVLADGSMKARLIFNVDYEAGANPGCGSGCSKGGCG